MFKKRDILIALALIIITGLSITLFMMNRQQLKVGNVSALIDEKTKTIFASIPEGSSSTQKIYFNFPLNDKFAYFKDINSGTVTKIKNGDEFDFGPFISHKKLIIGQKDPLEYDLYVTTGKIPILFIETESPIKDEPKISSSLTVLSANSSHMLDKAGLEIELIDVSKSPKPSYSMNIKTNSLTGKSPSILDFGPSRRFSLYSCYNDASYMRQVIAAEIFRSFSGTCPKQEHVELFLNGSYQGLYLLSERIDRQMLGLSGYSKSDKTHSVIYESARSEADYTNGIEGFDQIEPDMENDILYTEPLEKLAGLINDSDSDDFFESIYYSLDIDSAVDNNILFLLCGATDELASNQYIYRDKDDNFKFCPGSRYIWSFGIDKDLNKTSAYDMHYPSRLYNRLYENKTYREMLKNRWAKIKEIISIDKLYKILDSKSSNLYDAAQRDCIRWEKENNFSSEIEYIKNYMQKRLPICDNYINNPPVLKIGESFAYINEKNSFIFCSLPEYSNTVQTVSWEFSSDTDIYLEPLSCGKFFNKKNNFEDFEDTIKNSKQASEITLDIERPGVGDSIAIKEIIQGWALNKSFKNPSGIDKVLIFDGPLQTKENFIGEAELTIGYSNDNSYKYTEFNFILDTLFLENGNHELHIYAYDKNGKYSFMKRVISVNHYANKLFHLEDAERKKLSNAEKYDFTEFIYHGIMTIENKNIKKQYDFYLTTSDTPLVIINSKNDYIQRNIKTDASMQVIYSDPDEKNFINSYVLNYDGDIGIELRGASTLNYPKRQFAIELRDEFGEDMDISLLGMPREADWILLAPYLDKSLIRIPLAFELSNQIGLYAPRTEFVEVFLDNGGDQIIQEDYKGLYILTEKIKKDNERVDVEKLVNDDENLISGGYILEMVPSGHSDTNETIIETDRNEHYVVKYPNKNKITQKQIEWIADYMSSFENALYGENFQDEKEGYLKYIDIDSFIDYIIINELFKNNDIFYRSTFINKDRNSKLKLGPVWDFDLSAGNISRDPLDAQNIPEGFSFVKRKICNRLFSDSYFTDKYIARWKELRLESLSNENIINTIEMLKSKLSVAQARNFERWQILGIYIEPNPPPYAKTHEEAVNQLQDWLLTRADWIDNNINSLRREMTCASVFVNDNNCFEFVFIWLYNDDNWVKIYDIDENEVFAIDLPQEKPEFEVCIPDGLYTVRTFHDDMNKPIQEFVIGKPQN